MLVIIGILLAIAVPSYLGFKDRASNCAAQANVRAAVPAVEAYYADNGTYVGMTLAALHAIDTGIELDHASATVSDNDLLRRRDRRTASTWNKAGPAAADRQPALCP